MRGSDARVGMGLRALSLGLEASVRAFGLLSL